ncbi:MAG TPA: Type 1 glutamine amidotransferase-like domain-containing protein [Dehalococcoidia bacterium]|nr:Type 1 glutamine amidotransferase-like domain-containing protein [Dehalococcoidia bacterium]
MSRPGPLALVGSGEFLPVMRETDRYLIDQIGGPTATRVAVIPTASGLEPGMPDVWAARGLEHFRALGVAVSAVMIVTRADASTPEYLDVLRESTFFYFSGGNPQYVIETLRDTPAWEIIRSRHLTGAGLAGCSAGAMMLGGATIHLRRAAAGGPIEWLEALGVVPRLATIPHFDRVTRFVDEAIVRRALELAPPGLTVLGIDEDTSLVRREPPGGPTGAPRWRVMGRQSVAVFAPGGRPVPTVYATGDTIDLEEEAAAGSAGEPRRG